MAKLLLVEDDPEFALVLKTVLSEEFYTVDHVASGKEALERLAHYIYDLVVLDWHLPDMSGPEVCKQMRSTQLDVPVLMLTSMDSKQSKIQGLDQGADDYLTKACDLDELLAHLRALIRRRARTHTSELRVGDLRIEAAAHRVYLKDVEISLSKTEFSLLEFFMKNKGRTFDADSILARVWSSESEVSKDLVKVYINKLRSKLKVEGEEPLIATVHGVGYVLKDPTAT